MDCCEIQEAWQDEGPCLNQQVFHSYVQGGIIFYPEYVRMTLQPGTEVVASLREHCTVQYLHHPIY